MPKTKIISAYDASIVSYIARFPQSDFIPDLLKKLTTITPSAARKLAMSEGVQKWVAENSQIVNRKRKKNK